MDTNSCASAEKQRAQKTNTMFLGLLGMNSPIAYSYVLRLRRRDSLAKADSYRMVITRSLRPIPEMAEKGSNLSFRIIRDL
jgi:hypothetical protein